MSQSRDFQFSRYNSLLFSTGINLTLLFFFLFFFVPYARADGPIVDLSQDEQDMVVLGDTGHGWLG